MDDLYPLILAAGKGVRMRSDIPKVLHPLLGKPMLCYVIEAVKALRPSRIYIVVNGQSSLRSEELGNYPLEFIIQTEPLGTGHAVLQARPLLQEKEG
ncbi:MAG: NTP transferase domain-containing protein, partial [Candidatus Aminicenantes bacterium]|nr:NTP transferase domain-containing protein [Candidatus Aminicenantes bacterium]